MEEVFNENEMLLENQENVCAENCTTEAAHTDNNKESAKTLKLLKTGVALIFASSLITTGMTAYQLISKNKDKDDEANKPQSSIGSVSNKNQSITVSEDGYWVINGEKTNVKAEAQDGVNGEDGKDAIYVKEARVMYNDPWHITSYIQFVMSDNSYVNTRVQTNVLNDHYYEAMSAEDVFILVENYGVSKIRLANNIEISKKLSVAKRLTIDMNEYDLTYSSVHPISVAKDARLTFERGTLALNNNTGISLGNGSFVRFEEVNVQATSTVAEVIGEDAGIKFVDSSIETVEDIGDGFSFNLKTITPLFKVYGENFRFDLKETSIDTILNVVEIDDSAENVNISIKNSDINSTASFLNVDTTAVVPTISLDDNTLDSLQVYEFNTSKIVSGNFNFNPQEVNLAEKAFNVNGKWVVAESFADLVNKVEAGSVINLTEDLVLTKGAVITKELTLNLGNYTISGPTVEELAVLEVNLGGKLTINADEEGGINSASQNNDCSIAVWARAGGEVVINGGFYTNVGALSVSNGKACNNEMIYTSGNGSKITINAGYFVGNVLNEKWGTRYTLNKHDSTNSTIVVNGGFFYNYNPEASLSENPVANFVAEGKIVVSDGETYAVITPEEFAEYANFEEINYVSLHTDIDLAESWIITRELTLNLNGHTITRTNDTSNQTIRVNAGGDLTINGEGTISGVGKSDYAIALRAHDGGRITINGGTYTNEGAGDDEAYDLIYASKGGEVVINGGTFKGQTPKWLLNLQDNTGASIVVNGGTFVGYNPAESHTENPVANFVAEGCLVVKTENTYTVVEASLAEAIETAVAGSTVILTEDITLTKGIVITKELTLDLGTYTISGPTVEELAVLEVNLGGKLTINADEEGGINSASQNNDCSIAVWARAGGEVVINGGFYTNVGALSVSNGKACNNEMIYTSGNGSKITINAGYFVGNVLNEKWGTRYTLNKHDSTNSTIVVNGGFFYNYNPEASLSENPVANFVAEGKIVVSDGETYAVITPEEFAEYANFEEINYVSLHTDIDLAESWIITRELTLNLNGHTITRTNDTSNQTIRVNAGGDLTINGEGTISGVGKSDYAIALRAHDGGRITINGGTYTNEGAGDDEAYDLIYASKGGEVVINGGTFKGQTPKWLLNLQDNTGASIVVNGGTFVGYNPAESHTENPVANFVAEGYTVVENDGVYTVVADAQ